LPRPPDVGTKDAAQVGCTGQQSRCQVWDVTHVARPQRPLLLGQHDLPAAFHFEPRDEFLDRPAGGDRAHQASDPLLNPL